MRTPYFAMPGTVTFAIITICASALPSGALFILLLSCKKSVNLIY